ncbi:glycosyltransferase [Endozoicomonas sp. YOMI1]|uniref:glycosyltransferase n=1 Tax=Endozoicomonas sp. YOMI1 TaxID=2828739 RepID=UPI002147ABF3|nr:glycosyltransferase [Endozoicomonas sp. YOMI1]
MKHYFLSANEDLENGLLQSQFVEPVMCYFQGDYQLVSINRPFYRRYGNQLAHQLNILVPPRLIAYNPLCWLYLPWALLAAICLRLVFRKQKVQDTCYVARGYLTGLVCWFLNRLFGITYVFDPRSLYPLESLTAKLMHEHSIAFFFWMKIEKLVLFRAEKVLCVSNGMLRYYRRRYGYQRCVLIPCFSSGEAQYGNISSTEFRNALGIPKVKKLLLYFGSLNKGWNNIEAYTQILKQFPAEDYHILLVTQDAHQVRHSPLGQWDNVTTFNMQELPETIVLADCFRYADFGLVFMTRSRDWYTRLSVKFAEYTCQGLPVISNNWVGEAAFLIRRHHLEPSVILRDQAVLPELATDIQRQAIANWARKYFSPTHINRILGNTI